MGQTANELRADIEQRRENLSGTVDAIEDRVRPGRIIERRRQAVRASIGRTRDRVMGTGERAGDRVSGAADAATAKVRDVGGEISNMPELVADQTRGAPLIAGAVVFGAGALLAVVLPETDTERRVAETVQPQLDAATAVAKDVGRQALETAQAASQGAIEDLKESATEHVSNVTQQAEGAGEQVRATVKDAANSSSE